MHCAVVQEYGALLPCGIFGAAGVNTYVYHIISFKSFTSIRIVFNSTPPTIFLS